MIRLTKNYWRQFTAWVIRLEGNKVRWNSIRIITFYLTSIFLLVSIVTPFFLSLRYDVAEKYIFEAYEDETIAKAKLYDFTAEINKIVGYSILLMLSLGVLFGLGITYATMNPLKDILNSQKRFIADTTHELGTPLSIIKTNAEVALTDTNLSLAEATRIIKSNIEEVDRMNNVINTLLLVHKLGGQKVELPYHKVNMGDVVSRVSVLQRHYAEKKKILMQINSFDGIFVWGDKLALQEAISNVIKNSIVHTPENGRIGISMGFKADSKSILEIKVEDTGIGISSEDMPNIFNPFYRGMGLYRDPRPDIFGHYSYGMGLSIAKEIIERYEGTILADSKVGSGTTFTIHLPIAPIS